MYDDVTACAGTNQEQSSMAMMPQQQVVIMQQPAGSDAWGIQNTQMWSSGICGCFDDCGICK
jgi:hypothetical protein